MIFFGGHSLKSLGIFRKVVEMLEDSSNFQSSISTCVNAYTKVIHESRTDKKIVSYWLQILHFSSSGFLFEN